MSKSKETAVAHEILQSVWDRYTAAVNAGDAEAYGAVFTEDAIRIVPGMPLERGREEISRNERADYDVEDWKINPAIVDVLPLCDNTIYGIAEVQVEITKRSDGTQLRKTINAAWLIQKQPSGEWLLARHSLNAGPLVA